MTDDTEGEDDEDEEEDAAVDPEPDFTEIRFVPDEVDARKQLIPFNCLGISMAQHECHLKQLQ